MLNMIIATKTSASYAAMVVVQLAYGGSNILMKIALDKGLNQLAFVVYRHVIAMLILGPLAYVLERRKRPSLSFVAMMKIFILSSVGTTIHLNVYYVGLGYTSPTVASALSNVVPGLTFVISLFMGIEKVKFSTAMGKAKVLGTLACIAGSLIFTFWKGKLLFQGILPLRGPLVQIHDHSTHGHDGKENWIKGSLLILISYIAWSAWLILQAVAYEIYPARLSLNVLICFCASLQSSFLALFWGRNPTIWKLHWDAQLVAILYCGVVISALAYYLQTWCISQKGPVFAAMFSPLLLLVVGIFSAIAFAEQLHLGSLVGALVIIFGLYWVLWGKRKDGCADSNEVEVPCESRKGFNDDNVAVSPAADPLEVYRI
ncbi:hypothetical protein ACH5RR_038228 [Cinchona calisaya]|uniref:WAT1-related protein n=1 Tax=Cinchona calisaya TaxID=153742 RepID=A0ABD2Y055_9GENT